MHVPWPQTRTACELYHLTICFLKLYYSFHIICSVHMPQCVTFDYFGIEAVCVEGNSVRGPSCSVGAPEKAGSPRFEKVPGPQKVYFNHCNVCFSSVGSSDVMVNAWCPVLQGPGFMCDADLIDVGVTRAEDRLQLLSAVSQLPPSTFTTR